MNNTVRQVGGALGVAVLGAVLTSSYRNVVQPRLDALHVLPPLVKGYLRLGGFVGDGAVIDEQFDSTDVFIIVKTELVTQKYMRHYERGHRE